MDPRTNPYAPSSGAPPPELAGRDRVMETAAIALDRMRHGLVARSVMLVGLRGVGKTVLLNRLHREAEQRGFATVLLEAPEKRSLPALLVPAMRAALLKLDWLAASGDLAKRALRALGGLVQAMKLKHNDIEFGVDLGLEPGVADTGDLDADLISHFQAVGEAAQERQTVVVPFIDELQYVPEEQLAALITALHRCAQMQLPVTMVGAGLPQLVGQMGRAKSYAERLFEFVQLGPLSETDARQAITAPALRFGVRYDEVALQEIVLQTQGYPYFLQEWGKHSWTCAERSPISGADVQAATQQALAELGPGPHRSGDIAHIVGREVNRPGF